MKRLLLLFFLSFSAQAMDIPLPAPPEGGRNEIRCEKLTSQLLEPIPDKMWSGMPVYRSVKGADMTHQCPDMAGEHLEIPRQYLRNYQLTLKWSVYDAENKVVSTKLLPPYYLWGGVPPTEIKPKPPIFEVLARIRKALWGV